MTQVWDEDRALFGEDQRSQFPLLTKILDANDKLSVQVHPDDAYALAHEGEYGKTECWYIISAKEGAEIIYGVHADNQIELAQKIDARDFDTLFKHVPVKAGDFSMCRLELYMPLGPG